MISPIPFVSSHSRSILRSLSRSLLQVACAEKVHKKLRVLLLCDTVAAVTNKNDYRQERQRQESRWYTAIFTETWRYFQYLVRTWATSFKK